MGAQGGGLQVLSRKNQWIEAVAEKDELIINIGDMLSRLTNNFPFYSASSCKSSKEILGKFSIFSPLFYASNTRNAVELLTQTYDKKNLKKYDDILAGEF